jgi:hypothetical protein
MVAPILEEQSLEFNGKLYDYTDDREVAQAIAGTSRLRSIPTMLFCPAEGQPQMAVGALPKESLIQAINDVLLKK